MELGYWKQLRLNLWSASGQTVPKWVKLNYPIHLLQQPLGHRHPACPGDLTSTPRIKEAKAQNHYMKSTKIKGYVQRRNFFPLPLFLLLYLVLILFSLWEVTDPGDGIPDDLFTSIVLWRHLCDVPLSGPVASASLELGPRWGQSAGRSSSPHFCAGGSNWPGSPFFLFCNMLLETAMSRTASASFKAPRYDWLTGQLLVGWDLFLALCGSAGSVAKSGSRAAR